MASETPQEAPDQAPDYRTAQADAKAAAARAKALRPWYKKKRFILGIPLLAILGLTVLGSLVDSPETVADPVAATPAASASGASAISTNPPQAQPGLGDLVSVGSLDLVVHAVEPFDTTQYNMFNEANTRVRVTATNARGDANQEYNISGFYFSLVDNNGIAHDVALCAGCPDEISSVDLVRGGRVQGALYFNIPSGRSLVELLYQPLFSSNKARIGLR